MLFLLSASTCAAALEPVTVGWHLAASAAIPDVTKLVVFEETVCAVDVFADHLEIHGLVRGTTPVFIWQGDKLSTLVVHVVDTELKSGLPSLQTGHDEGLSGIFSTSVQSSEQTTQAQQMIVSDRLDLSERMNDGRLRVQIDSESGATVQGGNSSFNVRTASVQYIGTHSAVSILDFSIDPGVGLDSSTSPNLSPSTLLLRGLSYQSDFAGGKVNLFAGTTLPPGFLSFGGTRDVAGLSWSRKLSKRLRFSVTTATVDIPLQQPNGSMRRSLSTYALASLQFQISPALSFEAISGLSTHGGLFQAGATYSNQDLTLFGTLTYSALSFPLNQLRVLPSGRANSSAGANTILKSWLTATLFMQYATTDDGALLSARGFTEHVSPSLGFLLPGNNRFDLNYVFDRTSTLLQSGGRSSGNRIEADWALRFGRSVSQTLRVSQGELSNPFAGDPSQDFGVRDSLSWRINSRQSISLLGTYDRTKPSLSTTLAQNLALLSPALQQLYYVDPAGFLQQQNLPPVLLNLLDSLRPTSFSAEVDGQFLIGSKLSFSPSLSYLKTIQRAADHSFAPTFGFGLSYSVREGTTLRASLSSSFFFGAYAGTPRQVNVLAFGLNQSLRGLPRLVRAAARTHGVIIGKVFRDSRETGILRPESHGFAGLKVDLSNGDSTYTDSEGFYRFDRLPLAEYSVRIPLEQFSKPIRLTTPNDRKFDLRSVQITTVNFGLVDFSRLRGSVFNDYLLAGIRAPDAPGLSDVRVLLSGGSENHEQRSDASGEFEFLNVAPGKYRLSLDPLTVPDNYRSDQQEVEVVVQSARTLTADLPLVALRSVRGLVLQLRSGRKEPEPLPGVEVSIGEKSALSSATGGFLIRGLPAGDLRLTLTPHSPLPPNKAAPSGVIHLSRDPMEGSGVRIVLDQDLIRYFTAQAKK